MNILKIISGELNQNNYIIVVNNSAILIDGSAKVEEIEENLKIYSTKPKIKAVLLTHEHFDHIAEVDNICRKYNCNMYIHKSGKMSLFHSGENLSELMGNVPIRVHEKQRVKTFEDGEELIFDDIKVRCLHTPGHSKGSSTFIVEDNMFTGDTVFKMGVGRTDLFGGNERTLQISLKKIASEQENISTYYPGHGSNFDSGDLEYNLEEYI